MPDPGLDITFSVAKVYVCNLFFLKICLFYFMSVFPACMCVHCHACLTPVSDSSELELRMVGRHRVLPGTDPRARVSTSSPLSCRSPYARRWGFSDTEFCERGSRCLCPLNTCIARTTWLSCHWFLIRDCHPGKDVLLGDRMAESGKGFQYYPSGFGWGKQLWK